MKYAVGRARPFIRDMVMFKLHVLELISSDVYDNVYNNVSHVVSLNINTWELDFLLEEFRERFGLW